MAVTSPTAELPAGLVWQDVDHPQAALASLYTLQKAGQFCDVTLIVEEHAIPVHRPVLAVCCPYLFELFSMAEYDDRAQRQFKLKDIDYASFLHILKFAYTSRLKVPSSEVKGVYKAALKLEVIQVSSACSQFLADHLTTRDCLATRMFAVDEVLKEKSNQFIEANMGEVMSEFNIKGLPHLKVQVIGAATSQLTASDGESELFRLVLRWLKSQFCSIPYQKLDDFSSHVHVLYLNPDNTLTDCNDLDDKCDLNNSDVVKDYKSISRKQLNSNLRNSRESLNLLDQQSVTDGSTGSRNRRASPQTVAANEWSVVASQLTDDNSCIGLAILNGTMSTVSLHLTMPTFNSAQSEAGSDVGADAMFDQNADRQASLVLLAPMSSPRCAAGVASLNNKLVICGGYDRGECLETAEMYNLESNEWSSLPDMHTKRGRIDIAELSGKLYACGGSDGTKDLKSVERYDPEATKWSFVSEITSPLCHASMSSLRGRLFLVGGSTGMASSDICQMYDPSRDTWSLVAPLNTPRSQTAICQYAGTLFVIGGSDSWSGITSSVEMYDIDTDSWTVVGALNTARRGAAAVTCRDKLYVIGGTDGVQSLASTEIYDADKNYWTYGPAMNSPRANVGAVNVNEKIFVAGGFNGKYFLDTIEYFDPDVNEWCAYMPAKEVNVSDHEHSESEGKLSNEKEVGKIAKSIKNIKSEEDQFELDLAHCNGVVDNQPDEFGESFKLERFCDAGEFVAKYSRNLYGIKDEDSGDAVEKCITNGH